MSSQESNRSWSASTSNASTATSIAASAPMTGRPRVFGGQVAAQALVAAVRSVEKRVVHSLHSYFMRPGDPKLPILYEVDRIRDGRSFTTRRVVAVQEGEAIFTMAASFQKEEPGTITSCRCRRRRRPRASLRPTSSSTPQPKSPAIPSSASWSGSERPIEVHDLDPTDPRKPTKRTGEHLVWFRARGALPDDALLHQCVLTYASESHAPRRLAPPARADLVRPQHAGGQPRPQHLVPSPFPCQSMAPLRHREPQHELGARAELRSRVHA